MINRFDLKLENGFAAVVVEDYVQKVVQVLRENGWEAQWEPSLDSESEGTARTAYLAKNVKHGEVNEALAVADIQDNPCLPSLVELIRREGVLNDSGFIFDMFKVEEANYDEKSLPKVLKSFDAYVRALFKPYDDIKAFPDEKKGKQIVKLVASSGKGKKGA